MKKSLLSRLIDKLKQDKIAFRIYLVLQTLIAITMVRTFFRGEYESVFVCVLTTVLLLIPAFFENTFKVKLPTTLMVIILLFIFAAEILGEINAYYLKYESWDTILHTTNGFLCAAIGIGIIDLLNTSKKTSINLSPMYVAVAAFCFSMTIGVLWEFFEYGMDVFMHTDMQKDTIVQNISSIALNPEGVNTPVIINGITEVSVNGEVLAVNGYLDIGLHDTMIDMFVNFIGAVIFSVIGYFNVKAKGKNKFAKEFIMVVEEENTVETKEIVGKLDK